MKTFMLRTLCVVFCLCGLAAGQDVIALYPGAAPGAVAGSGPADYPEKDYFSKTWNTEIVTNVTKPTLTVFKPAAGTGNGSAIVICPGGGFMALSINSEGIDVAKYLVARGMTAFVLKYRLAHTGDDAAAEFEELYKDHAKFGEMMKTEVPLAVADGMAAVTYVRQHAADYGVSPDRVGIIGFSAGGMVSYSEFVRLETTDFVQVSDCIMPPADAGPDAALSLQDRTELLQWFVCRAPNN